MSVRDLEGCPSDGLAQAAFERWTAANAAHGHHPGPQHRAAIRAALDTMEDMAGERAAAKVFLSPLDPGVGKTQAVIAFARALIAAGDTCRGIGMMILVGRVAEAESLAAALADVRPSLAVKVSDESVNAACSGAVPEQAQVLITTQQMIERRLRRGGNFTDLSAFHYAGRPRAVRVWDEAWLPGEPVTLARTALMRLVGPLQVRFPELAKAVDDMSMTLRGAERGSPVDLPDLETLGGEPALAILEGAGLEGSQGDHETLRRLLRLSGDTARVSIDGQMGPALVSYTDTSTAGMAPLLVFDASGRVRQTYTYAEKVRGCLERLPGADKDYRPLKVGVWNTSGRKSIFQDARTRLPLLEGIAETIATKPDESWLVVAHKDRAGIAPLVNALANLLGREVLVGGPGGSESGPVVRVITWGQHMAVNHYRDFPNVILAGTLFMRDSHNVALTHLAQGRAVAAGFRPKDEVKATHDGETRHHVMQALCRGRVRQLDGEQCGAMTAYIIASEQSGIKDMLATIFPGCEVFTWRKIPKRASKKLEAAIRYLRDQTEAGAETLSYKDIQKAAGVKEPKHFARDVTGHDEWKEALLETGWEPERPTRPRRIVWTFPADEDLDEAA